MGEKLPDRAPTAAWGPPIAQRAGLAVWLRTPLPQRLESGVAALFLHGAAVHDSGRVRRVELTCQGSSQAAMASGMASPGLAAELGGDPAAGRAIFWGIVALRAAPVGSTLDLGLVATLAAGGRVELELGAVEITAPAAPAVIGAEAGPETVAICMATYEPPAGLLERQIESIKRQTERDWVCLISDDASSDEGFARIGRLVDGDPRFVVSRAAQRLGAYENFGRALAMVPRSVGYVALSDQDDAWYPDKLETLRGALGDARLVFSDMRVARPDGSAIADTYWTTRRPNHENFASLLLGNSVTGASSLFRRELLDDALPLPPRVGNLYHDHWLALVAAATGRIAYVDRPLYDYVQHAEAVIGHAGANRGVVGGGPLRRLAALRGRPEGRLRNEWRRIYFGEYCRLAQTATVLEHRLEARIEPRKRRALRLALAAERSPAAVAWLSARQLRRLRRDDTGGSEAGLLRGLAWSRAMRLRRGHGSGDDADLPRDLARPSYNNNNEQ